MELTLNGMEFVLKSGGNTILEYRKDKPMVYVGYGEESVDMYRGNFKIEDYVVERRPLRVTGAAEEHGNVILDLDGEITMKVAWTAIWRRSSSSRRTRPSTVSGCG